MSCATLWIGEAVIAADGIICAMRTKVDGVDMTLVFLEGMEGHALQIPGDHLAAVHEAIQTAVLREFLAASPLP